MSGLGVAIATGILLAVGLIMLYALLARDRIDINVLHDRNPQFVVLSDGSIRNGYTVKLLNMVPEQRIFTLQLDGLQGGYMTVAETGAPESRTATIGVEPDRLRTLKVFVRLPAAAAAEGSQDFRFVVKDTGSEETDSYNATFVVPEN